jgi:hypothetical protein
MNARKFQQLADRYRDLHRIATRDEIREQLRQWPINLMRRLRPSKRMLTMLPPWEPKTTRSEPRSYMPNGQQGTERGIADRETWYAFIKALRAEQDELHEDLDRYETGGMRVGTRPYGGEWRDITNATTASIKKEIASLQRTIDHVIAEQGVPGWNYATGTEWVERPRPKPTAASCLGGGSRS